MSRVEEDITEVLCGIAMTTSCHGERRTDTKSELSRIGTVYHACVVAMVSQMVASMVRVCFMVFQLAAKVLVSQSFARVYFFFFFLVLALAFQVVIRVLLRGYYGIPSGCCSIPGCF